MKSAAGWGVSGFGIRIYGLGAIVLGLIGLIWADFLLQWQPVPKTLPHHLLAAYASGAVLLAAGAACLWRRTAAGGAAVLALFYLSWVVLLHVPGVAAHPRSFGLWLGLFEVAALAAGGLAAFAGAARLGGSRSGQFARAARLAMGLSLLVFALSHILYANFTASMVPKWIPPSRLFWAYATAAGHLAAALALLSDVLARVAAWLLAAMFAAFAALVHAPLVLADPHSRLNWTMLAVTLAMSGGAWAIADTTPGGKRR